MKKRIVLLFMITVIMITGCGENEPNTMQEAPVQETVSEEKVQEVEKEEEKGEIEEKEEAQETAQETERNLFAEFEDLEFYFASGAGGWRTVLQIEEDGSFSGQFSDSDMGAVGDGYPNGTYYVSDFDGKFGNPVMVNDYTYSMEIKEIHYQKEAGGEEIIDGILYCYSDAYGLVGADEILIYLTGAPIAELPEEYMNWVRNDIQKPDAQELPFYGLYNVTEQTGFSSYDISGRIDDMMTATKERDLTVRASWEHDDLNQAEMNMKAQELYEIWDEALNTLWTELKDELSEDEFAKLLEEQRAWIAEKERAVEEAGKEYEGGSIYGLIVYTKAADITEERVYELYELLK